MKINGTAVRGTLCGFVMLLALGRPAQAQTVAYLPDVISGSVQSQIPTGRGATSTADLVSITPASTLDGHSIAITVSSAGGGHITSYLSFGNFSADPGVS
jgi:hypothetical protein